MTHIITSLFTSHRLPSISAHRSQQAASANSAELRRGHNNGVMMMVIHTHVHRSLANKSFIHPGSRHRLILVCSTRAWMLTAWATASEKVFQGSLEGWTSTLMRS